MSGPNREPRHFAYIDALRGFAFLGVLCDHCSASCGAFPLSDFAGGGAYGVQLFFLASAITLCFSMSTRQEGKREHLNFYLRRLFRIAPLFWLSMAFYWTVPVGATRYWLTQWAPNGIHASYFVLTALFLHGWHPDTFNCIVPGGWSIAVEMTFYLVFPFCFHHITTLRKAAIWLLCGIVFTILQRMIFDQMALRIWPDTPESMMTVFFRQLWFPNQFAVFLMGIFVYFLLKEPNIQSIYKSRFWSYWLFSFSLMFVLSVLRYGNSGLLPFHLLVVMGFSGIIISLAGNLITLVVNPVICHLGKLSYSCYLTHFAALLIVIRLFEHIFHSSILNPKPDMLKLDTGHGAFNLGLFILMMLVTLILTVAFSTVTHHLIENPGIAFGKSIIRRINKQTLPPERKVTPARFSV